MDREAVASLPKGGLLVTLPSGDRIQIGVPPETIKDTIPMKGGAPSLFVLAKRTFDVERGVSFAELEFPIYYNFFIKRRRVQLVCEPAQGRIVTAILEETLFTPAPTTLHQEYALGKDDPALPDMARELGWFRRHPTEGGRPLALDDVIEIIEIPPDGRVRIGDVRVRLDRRAETVEISESGESVATVSWDLAIPPRPAVVKDVDLFQPPMLGVTALGTGSGFDPTSSTSGFVFWINRRGVMVDPPVDATLNLREERIHPKLVRDVILTHVHADHDAGLLQKVLEEGIIRLYTTPTIMEAFVRKAAILTGIPSEDLRQMIQFHPVPIGVPIHILGAQFRFWYTVHSIPTIGFQAQVGRKRIVYSSDHLNVPEDLEELHEKGVLTDGRYRDVLAFPWDAELIIHEAGIKPLHTPPAALARHPERVRKRLWLVHTVESRVRSHGLRMMGHGIESTLTIDVPETQLSRHYQQIKAIACVDFLRELPLEKAADFLHIARRRRLPAKRHLIRKGEKGDEMYVVLHGEVAVLRDGREYKSYGPGDFVGDMALVSEAPRFADVVTLSPVEYLAISKADLLGFLHRTGAIEHLKQLAEIRREDSWPALESSPLFDFLTGSQLTQLQAILRRVDLAAGRRLLGPDDPTPAAYIILEGEVQVARQDGRSFRLGPRALVGEIAEAPLPPSNPGCQVTVDTPVIAYELSGPKLRRFLRANPGARLRLAHRCVYAEQLRRLGGAA